jgi:hypothetical protein
VLRRSGSALGFGAVALNEAAAVTGVLPLANGGTGANTAAGARTNLGLGTAATATVTTSQTDSTAGRVLRVEDFGMAGTLTAPDCTNLDDHTLRTGFYRTTDTVTTAGTWPPSNPTGYGRAGVLIVTRMDGGSVQQIWLSVGEDGVWRRRYTANQWWPWQRMTTIQGTVNQSGGVATGAIIERGSNSNGEYVRFADGTQICSQRLLNIAIDNSFGSGGLFRSNTFSWTFPATFVVGSVNGANLFGRVGHASGLCVHIPYGGRTTQAIDMRAFATSSLASTDILLTAIGRWF